MALYTNVDEYNNKKKKLHLLKNGKMFICCKYTDTLGLENGEEIMNLSMLVFFFFQKNTEVVFTE